MGQCCNGRSNYCDNESENIYRDILQAFPRFTYQQIKENINKIQITEEDDIIFSEDEYKRFRRNIIGYNSSKYALIHQDLIPDWESAWKLAYKENLPANILVWAFGFLKDCELIRYEILLEILAPTESYFDSSVFVEFIWKYLNINFVFLSKCIVTFFLLKNKMETKVNEYKLSPDVLHEMETLYFKLSDKNNLKRFKDNLEIDISRVYMKYTEYDKVNNEMKGAFTKKMFVEFNKEFSFLWNPLLLRMQYYNFISEGNSSFAG